MESISWELEFLVMVLRRSLISSSKSVNFSSFLTLIFSSSIKWSLRTCDLWSLNNKKVTFPFLPKDWGTCQSSFLHHIHRFLWIFFCRFLWGIFHTSRTLSSLRRDPLFIREWWLAFCCQGNIPSEHSRPFSSCWDAWMHLDSWCFYEFHSNFIPEVMTQFWGKSNDEPHRSKLSFGKFRSAKYTSKPNGNSQVQAVPCIIDRKPATLLSLGTFHSRVLSWRNSW